MKKYLVSPILLALNAYSQSTQVFNSSGSTLINDAISIEYSMGEVATTNMFTSNQYMATIGLLQPQNQGFVADLTTPKTLENVMVFPNPTKGMINVEGMDTETATLHDASGTEIKLPLLYGILDMSALPSGIYILQTSNWGAQLSKTVKIVKE